MLGGGGGFRIERVGFGVLFRFRLSGSGVWVFGLGFWV